MEDSSQVTIPTPEPETGPVPEPPPVSEPLYTLDASGNMVLLDPSGNVFVPSPPSPGEPVPPPILTMNDILNAREVILAKEAVDGQAFTAIPNQSVEFLRTRMIEWAKNGFANAYTLFTIPVTVPEVCSDGVSRNLTDYITFVSGKTIQEHVGGLQAKLPDFDVSFANFGGNVGIVVSRKSV